MANSRDLAWLRDVFPFSEQPESLVMEVQKFVLLTIDALGVSRLREAPNFFSGNGGAGNAVNQSNQVPPGKTWWVLYCHAGHDDATSRALRLGIRGPDDSTIIYIESSNGSVGSNTILTPERTIIVPQNCRLLCEVPGITVTAHAILGAIYWELPAGEVLGFPS